MTMLGPITEYLSPLLAWSIGIVIALMTGFKKWDKNDKFKKFYWLIGLALSAVFATGVTLMMKFTIPLFLFHFVIIYVAELGLDMGFLKPLIKELLPFIKKLLVKDEELEDKTE